MIIKEIKVSKLERKSFSPYGTIISKPDSKPYMSNVEFDFWLGIDDIIVKDEIPQINWFTIKSNPSFICSKFERHVNFTTTIIPVIGQCIMVFSLSKGNKKRESILPEINSIKAFYFDGTKGVNLKPGTLFWNRYPLTTEASFIVILKKDFIFNKKDTDIIDLKENFDINIKLVLRD